MHDLIIRGGTVVDGTGVERRTADVAVTDGTITAVGRLGERAHRTIDADGALVLPGWVDVHTHYDGQATWDPELAPSSWHGVTTTIFGNCSVGFAPVRPGSDPFLINLMEGVEDIPGTALADGIDFTWESFGGYLDALDGMGRTMDIGTQVPHAALRFYVMGERGADHTEAPTADEIARMGELAVEAVEAGAFGFTTSRTVKHRAADGRYTPSLTAGDPELLGIAEALGAAGIGVLQANFDFATPEEADLLIRIATTSGRPLSFSLIEVDERPDEWRRVLQLVADANEAGARIRGQVAARPIGVLFGLTATLHPLMFHRGWAELASLPLEGKVARLRDPDVRARVLAERPEGGMAAWLDRALAKTFPMGDPPDYEPDPATSVAARAQREARSPAEVALDLLLDDDGHALLYFPFENYARGSLDSVHDMLSSPWTVSGLSDGGAHVGTICDASFPTYLLTHWARDRRRGPRLPLEHLVARQTSATADAVGLADRGRLAPGMRADLNVVDLEGLTLHRPELRHDLPTGAKRFVQRADGYRHTFVAGTETMCDGEWTGATPGRLVRGPQPTPGVTRVAT
ncbi:MAG: amidohydrolase family protein [Acidimicrobiia bacterium]|nr:amidohydrolase family protein [Acidimicrobiia bacterium]